MVEKMDSASSKSDSCQQSAGDGGNCVRETF